MKRTPNNSHRLINGLLQHIPGMRSSEAEQLLNGMRLRIIVAESIRNREALQAALLTAINCASRAFLGGVEVRFACSGDPICRLAPWRGLPLAKAVEELGGKITSGTSVNRPLIAIGSDAFLECGDNAILVEADGWRGGIAPKPFAFQPKHDFSLGGTVAGALAVGHVFLREAGFEPEPLIHPFGLSLWNPTGSWLEPEGEGITLEELPQKVWLLGLGHLGQAFLWTLGMLPWKTEDKPSVMLQDSEEIVDANLSTGLLTKPADIDRPKTRVCADWAARIGFDSKLVERRFDKHMNVAPTEPFVALCGFDNAPSRRDLESVGFKMIVEAGLGGRSHNFDSISMNVLPNPDFSAEERWQEEPQPVQHSGTDDAYDDADETHRCGMTYAKNALSQTAVATPFVGASAACLVIGELIRELHGANRINALKFKLRSLDKPSASIGADRYQTDLAINGTLPVRKAVLDRSSVSRQPVSFGGLLAS